MGGHLKYLPFWQARTMGELIHCFCALEQITQVV